MSAWPTDTAGITRLMMLAGRIDWRSGSAAEADPSRLPPGVEPLTAAERAEVMEHADLLATMLRPGAVVSVGACDSCGEWRMVSRQGNAPRCGLTIGCEGHVREIRPPKLLPRTRR